ncbi:MAG: prepilin-type N-terminal cleavage/methylation domain-containing protein [Thermodesulfobacteriota bacterium]
MRRQEQQGFTLIEILIALFILSVVLLAISTMVFSVMRATSQSKETATATTLAQDKLESLKNASVGSLASGNDSINLGNISYLRQWIISTAGNIRTVTVTVNWNSRGTHNISMTTLRGD